jgi:mannose/cellobiose epimerase-like protein (N-acyl-D-glucosamine 2-epimerase family)
VGNIKTIQNNIHKAQTWLTQNVFPIWFEKGFENSTGCFVEAFSMDGEPLSHLDRRAMVQARQIFAVTEAVRLNLFSLEKAKVLIQKNVQLFIERYSFSTGGYAHSLNPQLKVSNSDTDLYTQAFVLFGLAKAYELLKQEQIAVEAKKLLSYLKKRRSLNQGGYTEIKKGETLYQSNAGIVARHING